MVMGGLVCFFIWCEGVVVVVVEIVVVVMMTVQFNSVVDWV